MFRTPRTWYLAPPIDREDTRPSYGLGDISSLIWEEKFGPGPVNEAKVEAYSGETATETGMKRVTVGAGRVPMSTTVLAYLILFMGFITFLVGAFGVLMLIFEEVGKTERVPFRYYAMAIGLISGGLGMIGIGQGLRLLLLILGKGVIPAPP